MYDSNNKKEPMSGRTGKQNVTGAAEEEQRPFKIMSSKGGGRGGMARRRVEYLQCNQKHGAMRTLYLTGYSELLYMDLNAQSITTVL